MNKSGRFSKTLCLTAGILLLAMAAFHGSGLFYMQGLILETDSPQFIKDVFPVLFLVPSVELLGFAIFGLVAPAMGQKAYKILIPLAVLVLLNAAFAFYLGATIPGLILIAPALIYLFAANEFKNHGTPLAPSDVSS